MVAFESLAPLMRGDTAGSWDIFIRNRATGALTRVPVPSAGPPQISANGTTVGFLTTAVPLVPARVGRRRDLEPAHLRGRPATVDAAGDSSTGHATAFSIDGNGGEVAFATDASDLLPGDLNGMPDVYVHLSPARPRMFSRRRSPPGNASSGELTVCLLKTTCTPSDKHRVCGGSRVSLQSRSW